MRGRGIETEIGPARQIEHRKLGAKIRRRDVGSTRKARRGLQACHIGLHVDHHATRRSHGIMRPEGGVSMGFTANARETADVDGLAALSAEHRLIGRILGADWSVAATRPWPASWFSGIDWQKVPGLAWQHKIRPMATAALREAGWPNVPADIRDALEKAERDCVTRAFRQIALLRDIAAAASAAGLRIIFLKGIALSAHLYGDPFIREAFDLDLLVHPDDRGPAGEMLIRLGLRPSRAVALTLRQEAILQRFSYDRKYVHAETGDVVECHHALDRNPDLVATDFDALWQRRATVRVGDIAVAIPGDRDLAPYLGIHAARHGWERWKWLADLAVLYRRPGPEGLSMLRADARRAGNLSLFHSWILLVSGVAGTALPAELLREARTDRRARRLANRALRMTLVLHTPATITQAPHTARVLAYRFALRRGVRYARFELAALFRRDEDWYAWRFPDWAIPFYYVLRPFSFIRRQILLLVRS